MKRYRYKDFAKNEAWLVFRTDTQINDLPVDIYFLMELPSGNILAFDIIETEVDQAQIDNLLRHGRSQTGALPRRVILVKGDPSESLLQNSAKKLLIDFEAVPEPCIEELTAPLKQSFGQECYSPASIGCTPSNHPMDECDRESIKSFIPDSYAPCSCASGKKYKFCCKKILREVTEAMVAAEEGKLTEALTWIAKAKTIVGESAEVLCREAIVYSFFDDKKSAEALNQCLAVNPNHPRAHYIRGIDLKKQGDLPGAIKAYETAIANYPPSDHFHLNETYNNLGTAFYESGDHAQAKSAWEKALLFLPSDKVVKRNLDELIYTSPRAL